MAIQSQPENTVVTNACTETYESQLVDCPFVVGTGFVERHYQLRWGQYRDNDSTTSGQRRSGARICHGPGRLYHDVYGNGK